MSEAIICIGSNTQSAPVNIPRAITSIIEHGYTLEAASDVYRLPASAYLNQVIRVAGPLDFQHLRSLTKDIELQLGRDSQARAMGQVPIDIDVVIFDGRVMRQSDFEAPYFILGYDRIR